jgi:hypothetical protein
MLNTYKKRNVLKGGIRTMKREFLKGLAFKVGDQDITLPDEVINNIIAENGKDIEGTKTKLNGQIENLQSELKSKDEMLNNVNSEIEKYKGMDIESIKKSADEWKNKYTEFENQTKAEKETYEKQLKEQAYDFKLKEAIGGFKFPNELTKEAFYNKLKAKNLPIENEKLLGLDDYVKEIGEQNPGMFITEQSNNEPKVRFAAETSGSSTVTKGISVLDAMKAANAGQTVDLSQVGRFGTQQ